MSDMTLTKTQLRGGIWEGVLTRDPGIAGTPALDVTHFDTPLEDVSVEPVPDEPGSFLVRIKLGPELLSEGVQTVLIADRETGERLESVALWAGEALDEEMRAEIRLLRAELDMLKRAFRRHCVETASH